MARKDDSYTIADATPSGGRGKPLIWAILAVALIAVVGILYFMNRGPETTAGTPASQPGSQPAQTPKAAASSTPLPGEAPTAPPPAAAPVKSAPTQPVQEVVHFGFNEADVSAADAAKVKQFCGQVGSAAGRVDVAGHADAVGSAEYNQALSVRRAEAVASMLRDCGLGGKSIDVQGYGNSKPTADNDTAPGRAENRRVEVKFSASR